MDDAQDETLNQKTNEAKQKEEAEENFDNVASICQQHVFDFLN